MQTKIIALTLVAGLMAATGAQAQTATNPATVEQAASSSSASGLLVPLLAAIIVLGIVTSSHGGGGLVIPVDPRP